MNSSYDDQLVWDDYTQSWVLDPCRSSGYGSRENSGARPASTSSLQAYDVNTQEFPSGYQLPPHYNPFDQSTFSSNNALTGSSDPEGTQYPLSLDPSLSASFPAANSYRQGKGLTANEESERKKYFELWLEIVKLTGTAASTSDAELPTLRIPTLNKYIRDQDTQKGVQEFARLVKMIYIEMPDNFEANISGYGADLEQLYTVSSGAIPEMKVAAAEVKSKADAKQQKQKKRKGGYKVHRRRRKDL